MKILALNVCVVTGITLLVRGAWLIYEPSAYLLGGLVLVYIASMANRQPKAK